MNKLLVCLFAALAGASATMPALGQDAVAAPARVVIAPPQSALGQTIKDGLSAAYYGASKGTAAYAEAQKLYFFYGERHFEPIWLDEAASGSIAFSASAQKILKLFEQAGTEGLRPTDYLTPNLDVAGAQGDPLKMAALETAFSAAAMRYASNIYTGRIKPTSVSENLDIQQKPIDQSALMMQLAASDDPVAVLKALEPTHPEFLALKAALATFDSGSVEQPITIPAGPTLKPGMSDERVPLLRERFELTPVADTLYDDALIEAIKTFQGSLGLTTDGIMGPATVAGLNSGRAVTREDILANMERWRWMPRELGAFHVLVNLPEYRLAIYRDGKEEYTTRVVIGSTAHPTPIFSNSIRHIVVNPYWNVPASIIRNEIAPKTRANPGYIAGQNMDLLYNGNVVSASAIDWWAVGDSFPFRVRQRPGAGNALGHIKFLFPNKHDVYLHDTPSKSLFSRDYRAYSHGCVRVQNPMEFADALLANETTISRASLEALFGTREQWVNPDHQIPVHLTYFTLRVEPDGTIRSFGDVYGHNAKLIEAMGLNEVPAAAVTPPAGPVEDGALSP